MLLAIVVRRGLVLLLDNSQGVGVGQASLLKLHKLFVRKGGAASERLRSASDGKLQLLPTGAGEAQARTVRTYLDDTTTPDALAEETFLVKTLFERVQFTAKKTVW